MAEPRAQRSERRQGQRTLAGGHSRIRESLWAFVLPSLFVFWGCFRVRGACFGLGRGGVFTFTV